MWVITSHCTLNRIVLKQECIRKHLRQLLQVDKLDEELLKFGPLSAEEEEAYNSDDPLRSSRITAEEFRMVLSESIDSPFNMAAQDVFVEEFLDAIKVRGWYPTQVIPDEFLHEKVVLEALRIHLKHVHTTYREVSSPNPRQRRTVRLRRTARTSRKGTVSRQTAPCVIVLILFRSYSTRATPSSQETIR